MNVTKKQAINVTKVSAKWGLAPAALVGLVLSTYGDWIEINRHVAFAEEELKKIPRVEKQVADNYCRNARIEWLQWHMVKKSDPELAEAVGQPKNPKQIEGCE